MPRKPSVVPSLHRPIQIKYTIVKMKLFSALALTLGLAAPVHAATPIVVVPTSITYTGTNPELTGANLDNETQIINGSGLSAPLTTVNIDTVTHADIVFSSPGNGWVTTNPNGAGDFFLSGGAQGTVSFEMLLGATYDLASFYNWSYDFSEGYLNANNIKSITLDYGVGDYASTLGNFDLTTMTSGSVANKTVLSSTITADRVRITVTDNYFGVSGFGGGDRVGAAEFAFVTVPEPAAALLGGLGLLGLLRRRR